MTTCMRQLRCFSDNDLARAFGSDETLSCYTLSKHRYYTACYFQAEHVDGNEWTKGSHVFTPLITLEVT
ncbi:hypothetical protein MAR_017406 [Mya arenaria]|uniref:Uncharacterized protein n=1 Tax=Mya arenaria TaxID=6604 RepID=A0ABY7EFI5_MYAAR|nr:hypothetical protein MAR_017406 [Mya arenaria]